MVLLPKEDIWSMPNAGIKTVKEIASRIEQINAQIDEQYRFGRTGDRQEVEAYLALMDTNTAELLNISVTDMGLSPRSSNALMRNGIFTFKELYSMSMDDIRNIPQLGAKSVDEVLKAVKALKNCKGEAAEKNEKERNKKENLISQAFISDRPFTKLLTDISQIQCENGTLYISSILDCYSG